MEASVGGPLGPKAFADPQGYALSSQGGRDRQAGNQAENSLEIPVQEESGEGRARGASWPPESGWGQALVLVRAEGGGRGNRQARTGHKGVTGKACEGMGRGACRVGCQQHEQYPAGAWVGPGPSW